MNVGSNKIIDLGSTDLNDVYSFSVYNERGIWGTLYVKISHNGNESYTAKWDSMTETQAAKSVTYVVEKLGGLSLIETRISIINIYGGNILSLIETRISITNIYGGNILSLIETRISITNIYGGNIYCPLTV